MQQFVASLLKMESPKIKWPGHCLQCGSFRCWKTQFVWRPFQERKPFRLYLCHTTPFDVSLTVVSTQRSMLITYDEKIDNCSFFPPLFWFSMLINWMIKQTIALLISAALITFGVAVWELLTCATLICAATVDLCILSNCFDVFERWSCRLSWISFFFLCDGRLLFNFLGLVPSLCGTVSSHSLHALRVLESYFHSQLL